MKKFISFVLKNLSRISAAAFLCLAAIGYWKFNKELHTFKRDTRKLSFLIHGIKGPSIKPKTAAKEPQWPRQLHNIPLGEKTGLVLGVKTISIRDITAPYNASIIEHGDGYRLFFRYDVLTHTPRFPFYSYIGCAELDTNLEQTNDVVIIDTGSDYSEDPRVVSHNNQLLVTYNDVISPTQDGRIVKIAGLDPKTLKTKFVTDLDLQIQHVEKNWVPFSYPASGKEELYFEYELHPRKLYKLPDPKTNSMVRTIFPKGPRLQSFPWPKIWGVPSGGTPARLVDGQYLAFFHSRFRDDADRPWYVIGAYTFEAEPPFKITAISHYPIMFEGMYDTPPQNSAPVNLYAVFPCGFVLAKKDGKDILHVACGENDCAVKIVTIDKELLLKNLKKIRS